MKDSVKDLILSVFKSYMNGESMTPHIEANITTVQRMLKVDNSDVYCMNTECIHQESKKCRLSGRRLKECLSIDEDGQCLSFSNEDEDWVSSKKRS